MIKTMLKKYCGPLYCLVIDNMAGGDWLFAAITNSIKINLPTNLTNFFGLLKI